MNNAKSIGNRLRSQNAFFLLLLTLSCFRSTSLATLHIDGTGIFQRFDPNSKQAARTEVYKFSFYLDSNLWSIRSTVTVGGATVQPRLDLSGGQMAVVKEKYLEESAFDGANVFYLARCNNAFGPKSRNDYLGLVKPGPVPQVNSIFHTILWLALGSGDYFKNGSRRKMELVFPSGSNSPELMYRRIEIVPVHARLLNNSRLVYPTNLIALDPGYMLYWDSLAESWSKAPTEIKRKPPFDVAFTNWTYTVLTFTNINSILWPLSSKWVFYAPRYTSPGGYFVSQQIELAFDQFEEIEKPIELPDSSGIGIVVEHRFSVAPKAVFGFTYWQTNQWLPSEAVQQLPNYLAQVTRQQRSKSQIPQISIAKRPGIRQTWVVAIVAFGGIALLAIVIAKLIGYKPKTK